MVEEINEFDQDVNGGDPFLRRTRWSRIKLRRDLSPITES